MTDDQAFIRTILASPGDDAPRLVYADWLEERGDERAVYVRRELVWAKTRNEDEMLRLFELGKSLHEVWALRITRRGLGVCFEPSTFLENGPVIVERHIAEAESRLKTTFPSTYRAFMLNYNGGQKNKPDRGESSPFHVWIWEIDRVFRPGGNATNNLFGTDRPEWNAWLSQFVVIGTTGAALLMLADIGRFKKRVHLMEARMLGDYLNQPQNPRAYDFNDLLSFPYSD